jgi:hypothetical protein
MATATITSTIKNSLGTLLDLPVFIRDRSKWSGVLLPKESQLNVTNGAFSVALEEGRVYDLYFGYKPEQFCFRIYVPNAEPKTLAELILADSFTEAVFRTYGGEITVDATLITVDMTTITI